MGLIFSKWSRQLCICKYLILVMYLCHPLWLMCVYSKYVLKWFMWWTCGNSEMVLTYSGWRHLILCCFQTNVLFPWLREAVLFMPDTRHRTTVHMTSWTILHYIHMCGWKLSGITFTWLVYCSGLNFSEWSQQLGMCKYLSYVPVPSFVTNVCL